MPWYSTIPCGKNYLAKMVPDMFKDAGVEEKKTNHSLRAAGVSQLFEAGVDEKVIQSRSGHRRLESLRMYERVTPAQEQTVSNILSSRHRTDYQSEVQRSNSPFAVGFESAPGVLPAMYSASWRYNPVFAPHVSSSQATQPSVPGMQCHNCTINIYQGPVSHRTLDQHVMAPTIISLHLKIWKLFVTFSLCVCVCGVTLFPVCY